jgi:hypothetical protein
MVAAGEDIKIPCSVTCSPFAGVEGTAFPTPPDHTSFLVLDANQVLRQLTSNSSVGIYAYPTQGSSALQPHAVSTAGNWSFSYDLNGNQTSRQ